MKAQTNEYWANGENGEVGDVILVTKWNSSPSGINCDRQGTFYC